MLRSARAGASRRSAMDDPGDAMIGVSQGRAAARALSPSDQLGMQIALATASFALRRAMTCCMAAAGAPGLAALDIVVLRLVLDSGGAGSSEVRRVLHPCAPHSVDYALRKLVRLKLLTRNAGRRLEAGDDANGLMRRYRALRRAAGCRAGAPPALDALQLPALLERSGGSMRDGPQR